MKKKTPIKFILICASVLLICGCFISNIAQASEAEAEKTSLSRLPESEELTYKVKWLGIPVGIATARINGIKKINGRDAYELVITAKTNDFCSKIYKVEDRYVSYMDVKEFYTLR